MSIKDLALQDKSGHCEERYRRSNLRRLLRFALYTLPTAGRHSVQGFARNDKSR